MLFRWLSDGNSTKITWYDINFLEFIALILVVHAFIYFIIGFKIFSISLRKTPLYYFSILLFKLACSINMYQFYFEYVIRPRYTITDIAKTSKMRWVMARFLLIQFKVSYWPIVGSTYGWVIIEATPILGPIVLWIPMTKSSGISGRIWRKKYAHVIEQQAGREALVWFTI